MTEPAQPTPGAPAGQPTPPPAAPPAAVPPAPAPANQLPAPAAAPPWERDGQTFDPERAWNLIQQLRTENASLKTGRQQDQQTGARTMAEVARLLGLAPDTNDPAVIARQLEAAQDTAWKAAVELQVYRAAGQHAGALLDSLDFLNTLDDIEEDDVSSPAFATALAAKVQEALAKRNLTAGQAPASTGGQAPNGPRPDPSQGSRGTPAGGRPTSLGEALRRHYQNT